MLDATLSRIDSEMEQNLKRLFDFLKIKSISTDPEFKKDLISGGMDIVGTSLDGNLAEMIEIKRHPWFIGCQFHPEFTSNPRDGHPIFNSYIKSTITK